MQRIQDQNVDIIYNLPTNQSQPSHNELKIVDTLFSPQNQGTINKIIIEMKDAIIAGILFIVFSLPKVVEIINKIPITKNSPYFLLLAQAVIFTGVFWVIKNFFLLKK